MHQSTPRTIIQFDPARKALTIESPKDVDIKNFSMLLRTNGEVSIQFSNYVSHNNPELVKAVAAYIQAVQKSVFRQANLSSVPLRRE